MIKIKFKNKTHNVLVIGDVMLDSYWLGTVSRISPEAPVPILTVNKKDFVLGGAANVASNCSKMNCFVELIGVTGNDLNAIQFTELVKNTSNNIELSLIIDNSRPTTLKTRIVSGGQQIVRIDEETSIPISSVIEEQAIKKCLEAILKKPDVIVISDYGKGFVTNYLCSKIIKEAKSLNIPVLVDPKGSDYQKYQGATLLSPNKLELSLVTKIPVHKTEELIYQGQNLCKALDCKNIVLTRSEEGISLLGEQTHCYYAATAKNVVDVCGAGDAVISALAVGLAHGLSIEDAVWTANVAGGLAVQKFGTSAVSIEELQAECAVLSNQHLNQKIHLNDSVYNLINFWHSKNETIVFTNGCFDLFHIGHLKLLESCKKFGTKLIIGINSDSSVSSLKGPKRPIVAQEQRAQILASLEIVDLVIIFDEDTPIEIIKNTKPHVLVKGGDYQAESIVGASFVSSYGGKVEIVPLIEGISTTNIINKIIDL